MTKKSGARWFFGVDNKTDFLAYALSEYSEDNMRALHPDDMQSIAQEAVETAARLGVTCPSYLAGMAEDPIPYMESAFADGLIPEYHEITKINLAQGTNYKNSYDHITSMRKAAGLPATPSETARGPRLEPSQLDAFASDAESPVTVTASDLEEILDLDAYVAQASGKVTTNEDTDDEDEDYESSDDDE